MVAVIMANTTDLMITSLFDDNAINWINNLTGLDFKQVTDGAHSGGTKVLSFEAFGTCPRSIGDERIQRLITTFKVAPFNHPEYAVLLVDCDSQSELNGTYTSQ
jgi:hypothetical protein